MGERAGVGAVTFGSRQKGARGELAVAKALQEWWRQLEPDCIFKRTPGSGGWGHGTRARGDFGTAGDLVTTALRFPYAVEVKAREDWSWDRLLDGKPSPVWSWWRQAQTAATEMSKTPLLVFRKNREDWSAMLPRAEAERVWKFWTLNVTHAWSESALLRVDYSGLLPVLVGLPLLLAEAPENVAAKESIG